MKKFLVFFLAVFLLGGCSLTGEKQENIPYEPETPAPDPHDGVFVSGHGTMTFFGDGERIVTDFDDELAKLTGLPAGEQEGTYAFLSGNLPPHGSIQVRYDTAHEMRITVGEQSVVIDMGIAAEDGKNGQVGVDVVTPERIPMLFDTDRFFNVTFLKDDGRSIEHFFFTESNGNDYDNWVDYKLDCEDGVYTAVIKPMRVTEGEALTVEVPADFAEKLKMALKENGAESWDGFSEHDSEVMDGSGFTLHAEFSDGSEILANGYMEWPPNYGNVSHAIQELFLEVYEAEALKETSAASKETSEAAERSTPKSGPKPSEEAAPESVPESTYTTDDLLILQDPAMYTYENMIQDTEVLLSLYPDLAAKDVIGTTADGREILHFVVGNPAAEKQIFVNGAIHAREYMTAQLVMKQMAVYLQHVRNGDSYGEYSYPDLWQSCAVHVVPMVNPDGVAISQFGLGGIRNEEIVSGIQEIAAMDGADLTSEYLDKWKANATGVDLNRNFDAWWEAYADPVGHPSSDHYKGEYPGSEPESAALIVLTEENHFSYTISYHNQGRIIYWCFDNMDAIVDRALNWASQLSAATGYSLVNDYSIVDPAGYSDWGIYRCQIPSVTIETASGVSPYLSEQFPQVWEENRNIWEITILCALKDNQEI